MKIEKGDLQLILILTMLVTTIFTINSLYSHKAEYETNMDWMNHLSYYEQGTNGNYPNIYWAYPFGLDFIYVHMFVIIPLLIILLNYAYDGQNYKFNSIISIFIYLTTTTPTTFIDHGYLKQILFTEILIIILAIRYKKGIVTYLTGFVLLLIQDINRWKTNFLLTTQTFNNVGFYLLSKGQFLGIWGFILIPFALPSINKKDIKIITILLYLMALFETRIILTLFILLLPQISQTFNKKISSFPQLISRG